MAIKFEVCSPTLSENFFFFFSIHAVWKSKSCFCGHLASLKVTRSSLFRWLFIERQSSWSVILEEIGILQQNCPMQINFQIILKSPWIFGFPRVYRSFRLKIKSFLKILNLMNRWHRSAADYRTAPRLAKQPPPATLSNVSNWLHCIDLTKMFNRCNLPIN